MGIRILIIEDENEIADYLVRGLREEGFTVERAAYGKEGWHYLNTGAWDVVLLDWWLPGTDGLALLRRFRQADQTTPILFLTARDAISDRVRGLDNGADDYLCKPVAFEELLARVRVMARRKDHTHGTAWSKSKRIRCRKIDSGRQLPGDQAVSRFEVRETAECGLTV